MLIAVRCFFLLLFFLSTLAHNLNAVISKKDMQDIGCALLTYYPQVTQQKRALKGISKARQCLGDVIYQNLLEGRYSFHWLVQEIGQGSLVDTYALSRLCAQATQKTSVPTNRSGKSTPPQQSTQNVIPYLTCAHLSSPHALKKTACVLFGYHKPLQQQSGEALNALNAAERKQSEQLATLILQGKLSIGLVFAQASQGSYKHTHALRCLCARRIDHANTQYRQENAPIPY